MGAGAGGERKQTGYSDESGSMIGIKDENGHVKQWNTHNLGRRLGTDVACAATAGGLVAPLIMTVDKCVSYPTDRERERRRE